MPSFFLTKGKGGTAKRPEEKPKLYGLKQKRKNDEEIEDRAASRRRKLMENDIVASDDEYSGDEDRASEGSDVEYEDTHEKNYRQAKTLLDTLTAEKGDEDEEGEGDAVDEVGDRLREHAAIKAGTLHRALARGVEIDEENEISHKAHRFTPLAVALSPCNKFVVSTGKESHIVKYSLIDRKVVAVVRRKKGIPVDEQKAHSGHIFAVAVSPDGKYIASGGVDCIVKIWDFNTLTHLRDLKGHRQAITCLRFRLRTTQLFSASRDRTVRLWDLEQMGLVDTMFGHQDAVVSIDCLNKERVLTCGAQDRTVRLWKVDTESQLILNGMNDCVSIDCVAMLNEDHFVSGSANGSICVWSVFKKKPTCTRQLAHGKREGGAEAHWVVSVAACPFTDLVASGSDDGCLRLWRIADDYKNIYLMYEYEMWGFINDLRFSLDGSLLACAVGREHRFGRWWVHDDADNQISVIPLIHKSENKLKTTK